MSMLSAFGGLLDNAWLKGTTNKNPLEYKPGEEMVFTLTLQRVESIPADTYFIKWSRTGDDGVTETGKVPASLTEPLVIRTKLDKPGFVRIEAQVVDRKGQTYRKSLRFKRK